MRDKPPLPSKPIAWIGAAYDELMDLPIAVRRAVGYALHFAQAGGKHDKTKPLKGFRGAGVLEIVEDYDGDTYRAVYTVGCSVCTPLLPEEINEGNRDAKADDGTHQKTTATGDGNISGKGVKT